MLRSQALLRRASVAGRSRAPTGSLSRITVQSHFKLSHSSRHYSSNDNQPQNNSFISSFISSIKRQIEQNRQLKENVKQLADSTSSLSESETLKKAKEVLEKAKATPENENVKKTVETLKKGVEGVKEGMKTVGKTVKETVDTGLETEIGKAAKETFEKVGEKASETAKKTAEATSKATAPIFESRTFQDVSSNVQTMISETASRYGGVTPRSYRQAIRQQRQAIYQAQQKLMEENPEAGSGMVLHKDSKWKATWSSFKENNPVMQRMFSVGKAVTESDNPVVNFGRWLVEGIQDRFGSIFEETETAQATAQIQMVDPTFNVEDFLKEAREFIIPEVMEAYLLSDRDTLKEFCGEGAYNVLTAGIKTQEQENLRSDSKLVDLRNVELVTAKVLDNSVPVLILSFSTQEIFLFRDRISGEVKFGKPDHITSNTYVAVMTIDEGGAMAHPVTKGWKVLELAKHSSRTLAL